MNKAELIDAIADRLGADKRAATNAVDALVDTITRAVAAGEKVAITGFGVFEKKVRDARTARNPRTGAIVQLKKTAVPKFRAGGTFKEVVSGAKKLAKAAPGVGSSTAKKAPAKKAAGKKATATTPTTKKSTAKKSTAKKSTAKKSTAKKSTAKKSTAKKAPARTSTAKKSTAKKSARR